MRSLQRGFCRKEAAMRSFLLAASLVLGLASTALAGGRVIYLHTCDEEDFIVEAPVADKGKARVELQAEAKPPAPGAEKGAERKALASVRKHPISR